MTEFCKLRDDVNNFTESTDLPPELNIRYEYIEYPDKQNNYEFSNCSRQLTEQEKHVIELGKQMRELSTKVKDITHLKERVESLESQVRRLRGIDE